MSSGIQNNTSGFKSGGLRWESQSLTSSYMNRTILFMFLPSHCLDLCQMLKWAESAMKEWLDPA